MNQIITKRRVLYTIQYIIVIAIFVYLVWWAQGLDKLTLDIPLLIAGIVSILFMRAVSVLRVLALTKNFIALPKKKLIADQLAGVSLGLVTPGKIGESFKIFSLGKTAEGKKKIFSVFFFEKMMDAAMYAIFGLIFALVTGKFLRETLILIALYAVLAGAYFVARKKFPYSIKPFFRWQTITLSLAMFLFFIASYYFFVNAAGQPLNAYQTSYVITVASVVAIISNLPGGLGARELTGTYLLSQIAGISLPLAGSIMLAHTFMSYATTWVATGIIWFGSGRTRNP